MDEVVAEGGQAPGGGGASSSGSKEADLRNQVKMLREELTSAQETAAAATGHAKQYESLAKSSDEAVKAMQVRDALLCPEPDVAPCMVAGCVSLPSLLSPARRLMPGCCMSQGQLQKCKSEYEERVAALKREAEGVQSQLAAVEKANAELRQQQAAAEKQAEALRQEAAGKQAQAEVSRCCRVMGPCCHRAGLQ